MHNGVDQISPEAAAKVKAVVRIVQPVPVLQRLRRASGAFRRSIRRSQHAEHRPGQSRHLLLCDRPHLREYHHRCAVALVLFDRCHTSSTVRGRKVRRVICIRCADDQPILVYTLFVDYLFSASGLNGSAMASAPLVMYGREDDPSGSYFSPDARSLSNGETGFTQWPCNRTCSVLCVKQGRCKLFSSHARVKYRTPAESDEQTYRCRSCTKFHATQSRFQDAYSDHAFRAVKVYETHIAASPELWHMKIVCIIRL